MKRRRIAALLLALALCLALLPTAAMAEEEGPLEESYTITFDASPGMFPDGNTTVELKTKKVGGQNLVDGQPGYPPAREGYHFGGWYLHFYGENPSVFNISFTADTTVKAYWQRPEVCLDPNGGDLPMGADKVVPLEASGTVFVLKEELPTPTREGYRFRGWFLEGSSEPVQTGDALVPNTFLTAGWTKIRTEKVTPNVTAAPNKIEAGAKKVELTLRFVSDGMTMDWRPLERALYMGGRPSDWEAAAKSLISGNFSDVGLRVTDIRFEDTMGNPNDDAYPYALYPQGVCPASGLVLTLEGEAKAGSLAIRLAPENFMVFVQEGDTDTVLDAASADIFNEARVTIPIGGGAAAVTPSETFTVKFDLNTGKGAVPKPQTVQKGGTVDLPDPKGLTPPTPNLVFFAWGALGEDGLLYAWDEDAPVTGDLTLYAGWVQREAPTPADTAKPTEVRKPADTAKPVEVQKPADTAKPAQAAKTAFTDVAETSPFAPAISWAVEKKITNGKTATTFGPGDPCTRAQIVTFLWRAAGSPEPKAKEAEYADVTKTDAYYYKAIQWAAEMGMEESGTFAPDKTCTRGQAMYFIWKARAGASSAGAAPSFTDLDKESAYYDAVLWAVGQGVTKGKTETTFGPDDPCTRGQIVTFLYRAYEQ